MSKPIARTIFIVFMANIIASCSSSSEDNVSSFRLADLNGLWVEQESSESGEVIDAYIQIEVTDNENRLFSFFASEDDQNCFYRDQINLTPIGDTSYSYTLSGITNELMFTYSQQIMTIQFVGTLDVDDEGVDETQTFRYVRSQGLLAEDIPECF